MSDRFAVGGMPVDLVDGRHRKNEGTAAEVAPAPLLSLRDLSVDVSDTFGLRNINLDLFPGHVHMMMGENGSGKSSLIHTIAGSLQPVSGEILIDGLPVRIASPKDAKLLGISTTYQNTSLFGNLSIAENIFLDNMPRRGHLVKTIDWVQLYRDAKALLNDLGFHLDPKLPVSRLNMAERQLVEIARARTAGARIVVFDEPTEALTDREVKILFDMIRTLVAKGMAILYVTHRIDELRRIGDELTILRDGQVTFTGRVQDLNPKELIHEMSGLSFRERYPKLKIAPGAETLRVENLSFAPVLKDIHFSRIVVKSLESQVLSAPGAP